MLKKASCAIAVLLLLIFSSAVKAQQNNIKFEHFSVDQGLSQSSVRSILQDSHGYMWFGTQDGLNRYDGYNFVTLRRNIHDKNSLSDNNITALAEDREGNLWIGTNDRGLNRYDAAKKIFTVYRNDPEVQSSLSDDHITVVYTERDGRIWVGTYNGGLNKFDDAGKGFTKFVNNPSDPHSISDNSIRAVFRDGKGRLWIGTNSGLNRYDETSNSFTVYRNDPKNPKSISSDHITSITEDGSGTLWIGTVGGLNKYDADNDYFKSYRFNPKSLNGISNDNIYALHIDGLGALWIGTINGLNRFNPENESFTVYRRNPDIPTSLSNDNIMFICSDRSGALWIGVADGGINKYDSHRERFRAYRKDADNPRLISDNSITAFYEDGTGALWIGTADGLNRYDAKSSQISVYKHDSRNPNSLTSDFIKSLYEDRNGDLLIGTVKGLNIYSVANGRLNNNASWMSVLKEKDISSILEDNEGLFWIGTMTNGLFKIDPKSGSHTVYNMKPRSSSTISGARISAIYEDSKGRLWVGTLDNGLNLYDRKTDSFLAYRDDLNSPAGISNNRVTSICEDRSGTLWIGATNGLNRFDADNRSFSILTERDGLANDNVYGILEDKESCLWISTNRGISEYNPKERIFVNYDATDGLQSNEFNYGAYYKNSRGEMFFGGINGFNRFYPEEIKKNLTPPPIAVTSFNASDSTGNPFAAQKPATSDLQLSLPYNYNFLSFEFAVLNYTHPEKNRYSYKMEGVDKDWIYCGDRRYVGYPNLAPGDYVFRVKGSNNDGVWNEEGAAIRISISPPLWKTWWAYLVYLGTAVGIGYGGHRFRLSALERRNRLLEVKVQERTASLAEQKEELIRSKEELVASYKQTELVFSALSDVLPGVVLDNKYKLESKIGSGGFGTVYRADQLELNRPVAVKVFSPTAINATRESLERFRLEGISACRINHPNAITVLDSGVTPKGIAYIVMELLEGHTLKQELEQKGKLSLCRIAEILIPVCDVLHKAHSMGIIHRDIKPDNIFLHKSGDEETVKLVDFGIAKLIGEEWGTKAQSLTGTGTLIGTPAYMAPERFGEIYDCKADVYSLGVTLYEMLCGRTPFRSSMGSWQTSLMHLTIEPLPPSRIDPGIPSATESAVLRALSKDPKKRPDAAELKQEFLTALNIDPNLQPTGDFKDVISERLGTERETVVSPNVMESLANSSSSINRSGSMPERWKKIDELLDAAMDCSPSELDALLDNSCAGDEELRREIESLLAAHQKANNFLGSPALGIAAQQLAAVDNRDDKKEKKEE